MHLHATKVGPRSQLRCLQSLDALSAVCSVNSELDTSRGRGSKKESLPFDYLDIFIVDRLAMRLTLAIAITEQL